MHCVLVLSMCGLSFDGFRLSPLPILRDYLTIEAKFLTNPSLCCFIGWAFPSSRPYYKTIAATFLTIPALCLTTRCVFPTTDSVVGKTDRIVKPIRRSEQKVHRVYE